jgi:hypothetical protein
MTGSFSPDDGIPRVSIVEESLVTAARAVGIE